MSSPSGNGYALGRDYLASLRLNTQHLLWKEQLGYVLHPRIPVTEGMQVADVGAGTGIWLVELSRILPPSARLRGFDIDVRQCPPTEWLPLNVEVCTWDAFAEVPDELVGRFDVVHVGVFMLMVKGNDPGPLLRNLMSMLKPGGYVQWNELDWGGRCTVTAQPGGATDHLRALLAYVEPWEGLLGPVSWIGELAKSFTGQGLRDASLDRYEMAPAYRRYDNDKSLAAYEEFGHTVLDPREKVEGEALRELIRRASEECRMGVSITADMVVVVGQK